MRGSIAKQAVVEKIKSLYGKDYIGEASNKYYVWEDDGGERVQIAIQLTCPKNLLETTPVRVINGGLDFSNSAPETKKNTEFTEEEKDTINRLIAELGL